MIPEPNRSIILKLIEEIGEIETDNKSLQQSLEFYEDGNIAIGALRAIKKKLTKQYTEKILKCFMSDVKYYDGQNYRVENIKKFLLDECPVKKLLKDSNPKELKQIWNYIEEINYGINEIEDLPEYF